MTLKDDEASGAVTVHEDATTEEEDANNGDGDGDEIAYNLFH